MPHNASVLSKLGDCHHVTERPTSLPYPIASYFVQLSLKTLHWSTGMSAPITIDYRNNGHPPFRSYISRLSKRWHYSSSTGCMMGFKQPQKETQI